MPQIIAVANLKGGVGKSTIAVNLACALTGPREIAMLVDADSQGTTRFWGRLGRLPVSIEAMPLEDRGTPRAWLSRLLISDQADEQVRLREWRYRLQQTGATYVVIDCPPHVGLATRAAISVADVVLIPVSPAAADIAATGAALDLIARERNKRRDDGPKCLVVPSRIDRSSSTGQTAERILVQLGEEVGPPITSRVAFADSVAFGQWVGDYATGSAAHKEVTALADRVKALLRKIKKDTEAGK